MKLMLSLPEKDENGKRNKKRFNRGFLTIRADKIKKTDDIIISLKRPTNYKTKIKEYNNSAQFEF